MNPECLGSELEILTRGVECPRTAGFCQEESRFVGPEKHSLQNSAFNRLVVDGERMIADKLRCHNTDGAVGIDTRDSRLTLDLFQLQHVLPLKRISPPAEMNETRSLKFDTIVPSVHSALEFVRYLTPSL